MKIGDYKVFSAWEVAENWQAWCGANKWVFAMVHFAICGGIVRWWDGCPGDNGILCFELFEPDGTPIQQFSKTGSRLIDIKKAGDYLFDKAMAQEL